MMKNWIQSGVAALAVAAAMFTTAPAQAKGLDDTGGYAERPLVLPKGRLRIDAAPSDYGYMDFGALNSGRGFRIDVNNGNDRWWLGAGAGLGVIDKLEVGVLALPISMSPGDFGNIEAYGRYQLLTGKFQLAVQGTIAIPTGGDFGIGAGVPVLWQINDNLRLDTGAEFEIQTDPGRFHLDVPLAFAFDIADTFFLGPRTGLRVNDFDGLLIPAGVFLGGTVKNVVDITGAFTFNDFINTYDGFSANNFTITAGVNMFIDVF